MKYNRDPQGRLLLTDSQASELYLIYWNEFITVQAFSEYLDTSKQDAERIIERGRIVFNRGK